MNTSESETVGEKAELSPEEIAHREKIDALNESVRRIGRGDLIVGYDAHPDDIQRAERHVVLNAVHESVSPYTRDRQRVVADTMNRVLLANENDTRKPSFLARLFRTAEARRHELANELARVEEEIQRIANLNEQRANLKERIADEREALKRARQAHEAMREHLDSLNADESLVSRYVANTAIGAGCDHPFDVARRIDAGRLMISAVVADWPRVERALLGRIADLEAQLAKLDSEMA